MPFATHQTTRLHTHFTAQLAQTARLLPLPMADLTTLIETELARNPALEIVTDSRCATCGRRLKTLACPSCARRPARGDEPQVFLAARSAYARDIDWADDHQFRSTETLADYVRRQIAPALPPDDLPIADDVLGNLDERGFLLPSPENCAHTLRVSLERVRRVLSLIQRADPVGVGARDVRDCLLIQLDSLERAGADRALVRTLIADHWEQLGHRQIKSLAAQLRVSAHDIEAAVDFIRRNLTPYPAHTDWHTRRGQPADTTYPALDAIIHAPADLHAPPSIELFSPVAGWLCVNETFKAALDDRTLAERPQLIDCVEQAELLVRGLQQRTSTLGRVLAAIVREQSAYLTGAEHDPHPMTRARLARQLNVHESTISRAVADKRVALPNGRSVPLDHFFDQSLAARQALRAIIAAEERPLTDAELAQQLTRQGHSVARRTVAKYRDIEHIPPADERGNFNNLARFKAPSQ